MADEEVAAFARRLADSGENLSWTHPTADVASTGGPSSLSTLLCPLFLRSMGWTVPKLGVPGRPAGGLDVLAQIPGYRTDLSGEEVRQVVESCGYAHFESGQRLAPLDSQLFRFRQSVGAQAVPSLVIASLLAKKIAVGVQSVGLDIRVAQHGNFGHSWDEARENAARFCRVAKILGLLPTCILTDAKQPYQPFIGRGEALVALFRVIDGRAEGLLERHSAECMTMVQATTGNNDRLPLLSEAARAFHANVAAQGGGFDLEEMEKNILAQHRYNVIVKSEGYISFNLAQIREILTAQQAAVAGSHPYPDPVGVILVRDNGQFVSTGETVMTVRAPEDLWPTLSKELARAVFLLSEPDSPAEFGEIVHG